MWYHCSPSGFSGFLIAELPTRALTGDGAYYNTHPEPILCGGLLGAAFVSGAVKLVERQHPPRVSIDAVSGQRQVRYQNDSFFFVPIRFWPHLVLAFSLFAAFSQSRQ